jgi:hypothetical protein
MTVVIATCTITLIFMVFFTAFACWHTACDGVHRIRITNPYIESHAGLTEAAKVSGACSDESAATTHSHVFLIAQKGC